MIMLLVIYTIFMSISLHKIVLAQKLISIDIWNYFLRGSCVTTTIDVLWVFYSLAYPLHMMQIDTLFTKHNGSALLHEESGKWNYTVKILLLDNPLLVWFKQ